MNIEWSLISSFGKMKYSRTSYYVLVSVPILVKLLEKIKYPTQFFGLNLEETIELPFTWFIFYTGAVFIAIGSIIYQLCCPTIVKNIEITASLLNQVNPHNI